MRDLVLSVLRMVVLRIDNGRQSRSSSGRAYP